MMPEDGLDIVEVVMAMEEAFPDLDPEQYERLAREIAARIANGEFGDRFDDDALAALVRKLGALQGGTA